MLNKNPYYFSDRGTTKKKSFCQSGIHSVLSAGDILRQSSCARRLFDATSFFQREILLLCTFCYSVCPYCKVYPAHRISLHLTADFL